MVKNIKQFLFIAGLLMIAAGAQPVGAAIWQWSTTAASNATADPSINWQENMAPSAVNDSARAMMAVIAAWRNDISAANTTGGTASAYTLTTSEGLSTTPSNGQMISFIANAGNNASATLQVDGGNTYPIYFNGAAIGAGTMVANTPYRVAFNSGMGAWLLEAGYGNPYSVPLGGLLPSTVSVPPNSNFILPAGQCISTVTYAAYWTALGSPASGACPGGQFAVLDLRGRSLVALDNLNGTSANRLTSNSNGCGTAMTSIGAVCANGLESWVLTSAQMPSHNHTINDLGHAHSYNAPASFGFSGGGAGMLGTQTASTTGTATTGITINNTGGGQAHPTVMPVIAVTYFLRVL